MKLFCKFYENLNQGVATGSLLPTKMGTSTNLLSFWFYLRTFKQQQRMFLTYILMLLLVSFLLYQNKCKAQIVPSNKTSYLNDS